MKGEHLSMRAPPVLEPVAAAHAIAAAGAAYYTFLVSRCLAARTADMLFDGINRLASSPTEVALLTLLALWFISWSLDRHSRAAQIFSSFHLRLLSAVFLHSAHHTSASAAGAVKAVAKGADACAGKAAAPATALAPRTSATGRGALPPSPGKDISSFRLPDGAMHQGSKLRRRGGAAAAAAGKQQQRVRWSMDAAALGGQQRRQQVRMQPKPRTSVDFDAVPASPTARASQGQGELEARPRRGASLADHRAAPQLQGEPGSSGGQQQAQLREQDRWQPRMQRIASGQELAELAAGGRPAVEAQRNSIDGTGQDAAASSSSGASLAATVSASTAAAAAPSALSSWLPLSISLSWPPSPTSRPTASAAPDAVDGSSGDAASPFSPACAAAAAAAAAVVARRVAASGSAAAAWASSTVDSMLRPLIPGSSGSSRAALMWRSTSAGSRSHGSSSSSGSDDEFRGPGVLQHAASAPLPAVAAAAGTAVDGLAEQARASACSAADHRRQSLDGLSSRHYSHGGVTAHPSRKAALENMACAARMQSNSARAALGLGGMLHPPGHLALAASAASLLGVGPRLGPDAGSSALASVGLDGDCPGEIRSHVTDEHLLQFAAVAGEPAAVAAAAELGLPPAWLGSGSLLGTVEGGDGGAACSEERWEQVIHRSSEGLSYEVWRQELRRGLFMYKSRTVFSGVSPRDLRPFHLDDHARHLWDENVIEIRRVKPDSQPGRLHKHSEWCLHQYRSRFPRPLAAREYQYARRVWHRPSDGGCYVLCRGLALPDAGDSYRAVRVTDIVSAALIRAAHGTSGASSEMLSLYFEDSGVRPGLAKMAVKGMWRYMESYEGALRVFAEARQAASAEYAAAVVASGGRVPLPARRRSTDEQQQQPQQLAPSQRRHRRRQLLPQLTENGQARGDDESGCSSGDDALHSTYAAMARRLRRGASRFAPRAGSGGADDGAAAGGGKSSRWAGRLVVLAGIKMALTMLTARR